MAPPLFRPYAVGQAADRNCSFDGLRCHLARCDDGYRRLCGRVIRRAGVAIEDELMKDVMARMIALNIHRGEVNDS